MQTAVVDAARALNRRFFLDFPWEAAARIELLPAGEVVPVFADQPAQVLAPVVERLTPDAAAAIVAELDRHHASALLGELEPGTAARILGQLEAAPRQQLLEALERGLSTTLADLLEHDPESAGRLMDTRFPVLRMDMTVGQAAARLRQTRMPATDQLFVVDADGVLAGRVAMHRLATADAAEPLARLVTAVPAVVSVTDSRATVVELLERFKVAALPVVDYAGRLSGVLRHAVLVTAMQAETTADMQTMVGASKDERALSPVGFAVARRLPWLHINLLTAFLAAAVVGLFEGTIAQVTALAVLMPVVAGQSGNTGAQALAVTMRGLALREIGIAQWLRVLSKEGRVALVNGLAVAATSSLAVLLWSASLALAAVIAVAMVISMVAAGMAGALIPVILTRLKQDPAQSSSIVLTTVTDVVGFFSFLGIAAPFAEMLSPA